MSLPAKPRDARTLSGLLVGLVLVGLVLLVASTPGSPLRNGDVEVFVVLALPLVISLVAYVRFAERVVGWEVGLLAVWGLAGVVVTAFAAFLATMGTPPRYSGAGPELVRDVVAFLAATLGLGVPYGIAGSLRRERPRIAAVGALVAPLVLFVLVTVATAAV